MTRAEMLLQIAREEAQGDARALAVKHGIRPKDLPASSGETLEHGAEGYRRTRPAVSNMPTAREALTELINTVQAEERRDSTLNLKQLGVDFNTGELAWQGDDGEYEASRPYLRRAYSQLCSLVSPRPDCMSRYHLSVPPSQRSMCFSMDIARANDRAVVARFRRAQGDQRHHIFAFVTEGYRRWDPDAAGLGLLETLGDDADRYHCGISYWGTGARISLIAPDETNGSGTYAAARIRTRDDGSAAIHVHSEVYMTSGVRFPISTAKPVARVLHRGDPDTFAAQVREGIDKALEQVTPWLEVWGDRNKATLPMDMETVIGRLTGAENIGRDKPWMQVQGVDAAELTRNLTDTWMNLLISGAAEETQAGLAYTVAAAAVRCTWSHQGASDALEHLAAALLAMTPGRLELLVTPVESESETQGVDVANLDVAEAINARRRLAQRWSLRAELARQEGDSAGAELADERAALYAIDGDVIEETGAA